MELYKEILAYALAQEQINITFPTLKLDAAQIVEGVCYQALLRIKQILGDDTLEDAECFERIEQIICVLEQIGSTGDGRHDFG